ncbi:MAG: NifB/NifX family molybdenum-iron cluster-binding protein [Syntrophomonadaceae bacterium]|nr:NifB/NifX family molybdenum-iron cluster-binding protein [Syntrophomonadaceae bacterium]MDD3024914.1 NifB/NifX family molybdenum-iron cluster-binding protein [Syntrophomonadaceae bacterium]
MADAKIAICANADSPSALVDGRFGRCACFMLWDEAQQNFSAISNSGPDLNQGAGTGAARELLKHGVGNLICNRIGPKAFAVMQKAGVKIYSAGEGMDLKTVLKQYKAGELPIINVANNI